MLWRVPYVNHLAVPVDDVDRSVAFYEDWFDATVVPSPTFPVPVAWVLLGKVQVHLVLRSGQASEAYHFGVAIDSRERFEALYRRAEREGIFERDAFKHHLYEATGGVVQLYVRDPSGNVVECDYTNVDDLDPEILAVRKRWSDYNERSDRNNDASLVMPRQVGLEAGARDRLADR
jgi:catechol 2,3-dioxygenase-like lactoylglutathione lyase family enzyme